MMKHSLELKLARVHGKQTADCQLHDRQKRGDRRCALSGEFSNSRIMQSRAVQSIHVLVLANAWAILSSVTVLPHVHNRTPDCVFAAFCAAGLIPCAFPCGHNTYVFQGCGSERSSSLRSHPCFTIHVHTFLLHQQASLGRCHHLSHPRHQLPQTACRQRKLPQQLRSGPARSVPTPAPREPWPLPSVPWPVPRNPSDPQGNPPWVRVADTEIAGMEMTAPSSGRGHQCIHAAQVRAYTAVCYHCVFLKEQGDGCCPVCVRQQIALQSSASHFTGRVPCLSWTLDNHDGHNVRFKHSVGRL